MNFETYLRAVLDCNLTEVKDEIKENIIKEILKYKEMNEIRWTDKVYLDSQGNIRSPDGCPTDKDEEIDTIIKNLLEDRTISDFLSVVYDSGGGDISCLLVLRKEYGKFTHTVISEFYGAKADKMYHELLQKGGVE